MTTDPATWDAEVEAEARRLAQHVAPTYVEWFDPGVMGPRDVDHDDYDPREDLDPGGHEADAAASRLYGGRP